VLGGVEFSAKVLSRGYTVYSRNCARCHGSKGNGQTTSKATDRPPRDLTLGTYKYGSVIDGGLPTDKDLMRMVKKGFKSNLMPGYDHLSNDDLLAVIHYIKTLSSRWTEDEAGKPIAIPADPWVGQQAQAIEAGKRIYHGEAKCWSCHPAYLTGDEIKRLAGATPVSLRADLARPTRVKTNYGSLRSPDFKKDALVAVHEHQDLYRIIATGIPGTPMPSWIDTLSPKQLWALANYVKSLN
jgi:mono/diheme cytochrome c family protein